MTNGVFADRMREAAVVLRDDELEVFRSAVTELGAAKAERDFLLGLVRLGYEREVDSGLRDAFLDQLTRRSVPISPRDDQLCRVMAALLLIERFKRGPGKRAPKTLLPDSLAASAVVVLNDQGEPSVHPDLASHARTWNDGVSDYLRSGSAIKAPPQLPDSLAALSEDANSTQETAKSGAATDDQLLDVRDYVVDLEDWLRRASALGRLAAIEEQQSIVLWLMSSRSEEDEVSVIRRSCTELVALARFLPGPPAFDQLLIRRLGPAARATIDVQKLAGGSSRAIPDEVRDFLLLLNGVPNQPERTASGGEVALSLYNELQLAELANTKDTQ